MTCLSLFHSRGKNQTRAGLYVITCVPLGKHYIGESNFVLRRLRAHKNLLRRGLHENRELQQDFITYTEKNFVFEPLLIGYGASKKQRELIETLILSTLPQGKRYNVYVNWRKRGQETNPFFGKTHTLEARQAQKQAKQGKPSPFAGHTQTNQVKRVVSEVNTGKRDKRKPLRINDVFYESVSEASQVTGLSRRLIRERCTSDSPRFENYHWEIKTES